MGEFTDSKTALIADVDCTTDGKALCEEVGVRGYPTIKHGDPNALEDYKGGRDFESLKKFAEENLGPTCGPTNLDLCDADKKALVEKFTAMSDADLDASIKEKTDAIEALEKGIKDLLESLQKQYKDATEKTKKEQDEITASGLGLMKSVRAHKKAAKAEL